MSVSSAASHREELVHQRAVSASSRSWRARASSAKRRVAPPAKVCWYSARPASTQRLVAVEERQQRDPEPARRSTARSRAGCRSGSGARRASVVLGVQLGVEVVEPAVGAVVDGEPEDRHVVGVHHAVHEAHRLPVRDQHRGAPRDLVEQGGVGLVRAARRAPGRSACERVVGELLQQRVRRRGDAQQLEVAEAQEASAPRGTRRRPARPRGCRRRTCRAPPARRWPPARARGWWARRGGASPRCTGTRASTSAAPRGRRRGASTAWAPRP